MLLTRSTQEHPGTTNGRPWIVAMIALVAYLPSEALARTSTSTTHSSPSEPVRTQEITVDLVDGSRGFLCSELVTLEINTDLQANQTTWQVIDPITTFTVAAGGPYFPGFQINITTNFCVPEGCYILKVFDSAGDGMLAGFNGGYQLRNTVDNRRILDNQNNGDFGSLSQITGNAYSFCMPISDVEPIYTSCDKYWWKSGEYIVATPDDDVSAQWVVDGLNSVQSPTTGYEFWIYNPNGGYSFRKFRSHTITDGFGNVGATRACHMKLNNWVVANHIPEHDLMNVRIRPRVLNVNGDWGPTCLFIRNEALAQCPPTKLMDIPGNQYLSCGQFRQFIGGQRVYARPIGGSTQYQWRFRIPAENVEIIRTTNTYILNFPWGIALGDPLLPGKTYEVDVRAFKGGAWCVDPADPDSVWGDICLLTIQIPPAQGGNQNIELERIGGLTIWPNPNQGDQFQLNVTDLPLDAAHLTMELTDLSGKSALIRQIPIQDGTANTIVNLNGQLATGMYLVKFTSGEFRSTQRLVIQR